jgi:predicted aldo/keto reductase-like oxidoreductase
VALGKESFLRLIRYAYDQGITYIDAAQSYQTFDWIGEAIKGLPREKLFLQSKVPGQPSDVLAVIDRHRKTYNTDYIDSLLIHCMTKEGWTDDWKRVMDGFNEAQQKKWIRAKGVSCHTIPALRNATASDWTEVQLVRVNPQGKFTDGAAATWNAQDTNDIAPVMREIKTMREKGRGVIGMKIFGNGLFTDPADREKSIRFAMACRDIDAVVIGFTSAQQIDEAIQRINRALAEA